MPQTQLRLKSLSGVTCIPRSCHVREQAEYGIANLIALKINTYYLERELLGNHDCGVGGGSKPSVARPCFLGFLILALFRLQNIQHRWVIAPYFLRFPPFQNFHLLTFTLPLPLPLLPQLSRAPFPFLSSIIGTKFLLVQILLYKTKPVHNHTR